MHGRFWAGVGNARPVWPTYRFDDPCILDDAAVLNGVRKRANIRFEQLPSASPLGKTYVVRERETYVVREK